MVNLNLRKCLKHLSVSVNCRGRYLSSVSTQRSRYKEELDQSLRVPEEYWGRIAENIIWEKKWDKVLDNSNPPFVKWFAGGELSLCYNAVDRHVDEGFGDETAIIWDSSITNRSDLSLK